MIPWSTVRIGGKDIYSVVRDNEARIGKDPYDEMKAETIKAGWEIFNRKGNTDVYKRQFVYCPNIL